MQGLAQGSRGQILGRVTDPSGAVIVGATVRAMNTATNVVTTASTNQTGDYTLPFLVAGDYEVSVDAPGFKKIQRKGSRAVRSALMGLLGESSRTAQLERDPSSMDLLLGSQQAAIYWDEKARCFRLAGLGRSK